MNEEMWAIEYLSKYVEYCLLCEERLFQEHHYKSIQTIINLVKKQQKEIEKLKSRKYILNAETNEIKEIPISDDYISKDKIKEIKARLEEIDNLYKMMSAKDDKIEILKDNLKEERDFNKSLLETLKECVNKDYLHKMILFKDGEIEKLKEAYQVLKDDLEEHRIVYIDTPEFEEKYISKDKIKEIIEDHKKFLSNEFSKYDEDDIEHRKAIQYATARLSFLLADIYKLGE